MSTHDIEKMLDPRIPSDVVDLCKAIVRKGFEIGHAFGEKANEWIDYLFDNLK